jgi:hypothetical protein
MFVFYLHQSFAVKPGWYKINLTQTVQNVLYDPICSGKQDSKTFVKNKRIETKVHTNLLLKA